MDGYQALANAIVLQAAQDYRAALKSLARNPDNRLVQSDINSLERFFRSSWYSILTNLDGELLMQKLREENF